MTDKALNKLLIATSALLAATLLAVGIVHGVERVYSAITLLFVMTIPAVSLFLIAYMAAAIPTITNKITAIIVKNKNIAS